MPDPVASDRLEIITPEGQVSFYFLDPVRGITNVGSHPDNDIVLDGDGIAPFQAVIDHRQKPFHLLRLAVDRPTDPPAPLTNWDTIAFEGYTLIYLEGEAAARADETPPELPTPPLPADAPGDTAQRAVASAAQPTPASAIQPVAANATPVTEPASEAEPRPAPPAPERPLPPQGLTLVATPATLAVEPGQAATFQILLNNSGREQAEFTVKASGAAAPWVTLPFTSGHLAAGQQVLGSVTVQPPRQPSLNAGDYSITLEITAAAQPEPNAPARVTLTLKPYSELAVTAIAPHPQNIYWSQASTRLSMAVTNAGNTEASLEISGEDEQRLCQIEFQTAAHAPWQPKQTEVRLLPGQTLPVAIRLTPLARRFAGLGPRLHFFTVTVAPEASERGRRAVLGQVRQFPLFGAANLILLALILIGLLPWLFRPAIYDFAATPGQITGGQTATLRWSAAPFSTLRIAPEVGWVTGLTNQQSVSPKHDTVYTLTAENFLTWLNPELFRAARATRVLVDPVLPRMRLTVDQTTVPAGGLVTVSWQILNATDLVLLQNGVPEIIPPEQYSSGQRLKPIPSDTTFVLVARNEYTPPDGITATVTVRVPGASATPTAAALPVIEKFEVSPAEIFAGEPVRLEWAVSGVDSVTISPEPGASAPSGAVVLRPQQTTTYNLSASKNGVPIQLVKQVVVKPAPVASPANQAPAIDAFTATPAEAAPDSPESQHILIAWTISGEVSRVEISRPGLPTVPGLPAQGTLEVAANTTTIFTLTAYNGDAVTSKTLTVQVSAALPRLNSLSPASVAAGDSGFTLVVNGTGFVRTSAIWWNGAPRPTTYINNSQLTVAIAAADLALATTVNVTVVTPAPGGGTSTPLAFAVTNPLPVITSLNPAAVQAGGAAFALEINGTGFNTQSQVRWNGIARIVSIVTATKLTILIPASDIAAPGMAQVSVLNAGPGGGLAGAALAVSAPPTLTPTPTETATVTATPAPTLTPTPTETPTTSAAPAAPAGSRANLDHRQ